RIFGARVLLRQDADDRPFPRDRLLDQSDALASSDIDGDDAPRKQHRIPERKDRDQLGDLDRTLGAALLPRHIVGPSFVSLVGRAMRTTLLLFYTVPPRRLQTRSDTMEACGGRQHSRISLPTNGDLRCVAR